MLNTISFKIHYRLAVNIAVALMLGTLYINSGNEGSRVIDNYNLLFAILMHHSMANMMLTVLTCKYALECVQFHCTNLLMFVCSPNGNGDITQGAFQSMVLIESLLYVSDIARYTRIGKDLSILCMHKLPN